MNELRTEMQAEFKDIQGKFKDVQAEFTNVRAEMRRGGELRYRR